MPSYPLASATYNAFSLYAPFAINSLVTQVKEKQNAFQRTRFNANLRHFVNTSEPFIYKPLCEITPAVDAHARFKKLVLFNRISRALRKENALIRAVNSQTTSGIKDKKPKIKKIMQMPMENVRVNHLSISAYSNSAIVCLFLCLFLAEQFVSGYQQNK